MKLLNIIFKYKNHYLLPKIKKKKMSSKNSLKTTRSTCLYGVIEKDSAEKKRFDFSTLFKKENQSSILLKRLSVFYGPIKKINEEAKTKYALKGFEAFYIDYKTGEHSKAIYNGIEKDNDNNEVKEISLEDNDYFSECSFGFDEFIDHIIIKTAKGKEIEFGEKNENEKIISTLGEDNMIQFFWGDTSLNGIKALAFKYISRKTFSFYRIFGILKLRYKLEHDKSFKEENLNGKNNNLENDISMKYLLKTCLLPSTVFSAILKFC